MNALGAAAAPGRAFAGRGDPGALPAGSAVRGGGVVGGV